MSDTPHDRTVTVEIEAYIDLDEAEVWPDGAPENWTIDDLRKALEAPGSLARLITEWNLSDDITVKVTDDSGHTAEVWS